jgi:hypothetical protein
MECSLLQELTRCMWWLRSWNFGLHPSNLEEWP